MVDRCCDGLRHGFVGYVAGRVKLSNVLEIHRQLLWKNGYAVQHALLLKRELVQELALSQTIPNTTASTMTEQVTSIYQLLQMLLCRVSICTRQFHG